MGKRLVLIDGHAVIFRAYYAFPQSLRTAEGDLANAVFGFASILFKVIEELQPTHIAVAFDMGKPTFRHLDYVGYKAQRPEVDKELIGQIDKVREVVDILNIPQFGVEGFEADDVIGTLSRQANGSEVVIVTGDQDAMQLVNENVKVYLPARGKVPAKIYGVKEVENRYGFSPLQMIDYKGLAGDASDNIPGVKGVGPKTATSLLNQFGSVEKIYEELDKAIAEGKISKGVGEKLTSDYEMAVMSKKLATIVLDVPVTLELDDCQTYDYDKEKARDFFEKLGFRSMVGRLPTVGVSAKETAEPRIRRVKLVKEDQSLNGIHYSEIDKSKDKNKQMGLF